MGPPFEKAAQTTFMFGLEWALIGLPDPGIATPIPLNVKPPGMNPHLAGPEPAARTADPASTGITPHVRTPGTTAGKNGPERRNHSPADRILSGRIPDRNHPSGRPAPRGPNQGLRPPF